MTNGTDTVTILGDRVVNAPVGAAFEIIDLRLSATSPAFDAGQHRVDLTFEFAD